MRQRLYTLLFFVILVQTVIGQTLIDQFDSTLDSIYVANPKATGIIIHVEAPDFGISWSGARGVSAKESNDKLNVDQAVLIASNTKTYVAASIIRLVELGHFKLDDQIGELMSDQSKDRLLSAKYELDKISIRHLLSHTSGITDYVNADYFERVNGNKLHRWTKDEQIALAVKTAGPYANPGEKYQYGDINYLLLAEIIEQSTGKQFYIAMRELLKFKELELNQTWFYTLEEPLQKPLPFVHQYWNKFEMDSYDFDPSWDLYGGGGIASNAKELAQFYQYLFEGKIVEDSLLLKEMYTFVLPPEQSVYCLGVRNISFFKLTQAYYHGGFWGTDAMYVPELNASLSAITLEKEARHLNAELHKIIVELLLSEKRK